MHSCQVHVHAVHLTGWGVGGGGGKGGKVVQTTWGVLPSSSLCQETAVPYTS